MHQLLQENENLVLIRIIVTPAMSKDIELDLEKRKIPYVTLNEYENNYSVTKCGVFGYSKEYKKFKQLIKNAKNIIDLGCGSNPFPKAPVAVDKYIDPVHRKYGSNETICIEEIEKKGCKFIEADIENLPFMDKSFDVAFSHHVVEHLDNPVKALKEMQRIAKRGIIMCPAIFAEYAFGRKYHKWEISYREDTIIFIEKKDEKLWFGEGVSGKIGELVVPEKCNPFDKILNDGKWYEIEESNKELSEYLQKYYYGHFSIIENVFIWENEFNYVIIYKDGKVESSFES